MDVDRSHRRTKRRHISIRGRIGLRAAERHRAERCDYCQIVAGPRLVWVVDEQREEEAGLINTEDCAELKQRDLLVRATPCTKPTRQWEKSFFLVVCHEWDRAAVANSGNCRLKRQHEASRHVCSTLQRRLRADSAQLALQTRRTKHARTVRSHTRLTSRPRIKNPSKGPATARTYHSGVATALLAMSLSRRKRRSADRGYQQLQRMLLPP